MQIEIVKERCTHYSKEFIREFCQIFTLMLIFYYIKEDKVFDVKTIFIKSVIVTIVLVILDELFVIGSGVKSGIFFSTGNILFGSL